MRKNLLIIFLVFFSVYGIHYQKGIIYIDEPASILISNGIPFYEPISLEEAFTNKYYTNISPKEIKNNNTLRNVWDKTIQDGGNATLYYIMAHYWAQVFAPAFGIIPSLRLMSYFFALMLSLLFYAFCKKHFDKNLALGLSILLITIDYKFGIFIRTYIISTCFLFLFFYLYIDLIKNSPSQYYFTILLVVVSFILPFLHFFNIIFLGFAFVFAFLYFRKEVFLKIQIPILVSLAVFFIFYIFFNQEGRAYQSYVHQFYKAIAVEYEIHISIKNLILKNADLYLFFSGLNFPYIRIRHIFPILLLPVFIIIYSAFKSELKIWIKNSPLVFSLFFLIGFLFFLNGLAIISGHTTSLHIPWYSSSIIPFFVLVIGFFVQYYPKIKNLFYFYTGITFAFCIFLAPIWRTKEPEQLNQNGLKLQQLLKKIDNQY
ncbi:MAG: glycosyltransferase family 39 protein [Raineya sp.]|jgi:hypothetical protein|nr:glycosyltransferase family 39 protein [Raineya sp.]